MEPLIRRIEGLQEVIARMKSDHATVAKAEGQLRSQMETLHRERNTLAAEAARYENAAHNSNAELQSYRKRLKGAQDTIANLEKQLSMSLARIPSAVPKPAALVKPSLTQSSSEQRKSQTQLLRARTKNNNPPSQNVATVCEFVESLQLIKRYNIVSVQKPKPQPPKVEPTVQKQVKKPKPDSSSSSGSSEDESDYNFDFEEEETSDTETKATHAKKKPDDPKDQAETAPTTNPVSEEKEAIDTGAAKEQMDSDDDFIDHLLSEDESVKSAESKTKNKDNKPPQEVKPKVVKVEPPREMPSKLKMPAANVAKPATSKETSAKDNVPSKLIGKDNKPPQTQSARDDRVPDKAENDEAIKKGLSYLLAIDLFTYHE